MFIVLCSALTVLAGCNKKKAYVIDDKLMQEDHIFVTSQEPRFQLDISDELCYLNSQDHSKNDVALKVDKKQYRFVSKNSDYFIVIEMTTMDIGEWGVNYPWETTLEKETHGSKTFPCGIGTIPKDGHAKSTYKAWMYVPGGIGFSGSTRVIVYYVEKGDHQDDSVAFSARANTRTNFKMQ